ncbi:PhzF family phenazine biosynthesis protein [Cupriavidus sp. PET2-C1]
MPTTPGAVTVMRVFVRGANAARGGNPVPLVADARGMSDAAMQQVALSHGHESAFVLPPSDSRFDWRLRFFVPQHEMEMCGHATVGTLWALRQWKRWTSPTAWVETLSGPVVARWDEAHQRAWISQPPVNRRALSEPERQRVADVLRLPAGAAHYAMTNASTSRVKTLVALPDVAALNRLQPDFDAMAALCESIGSTGLYPFAMDATAPHVVHARQFPKSSGYPEDAATGIAAAALWGHLIASGAFASDGAGSQTVTVMQGEAMGCPSEIQVSPRYSPEGGSDGCWLSGNVEWEAP